MDVDLGANETGAAADGVPAGMCSRSTDYAAYKDYIESSKRRKKLAAIARKELRPTPFIPEPKSFKSSQETIGEYYESMLAVARMAGAGSIGTTGTASASASPSASPSNR